MKMPVHAIVASLSVGFDKLLVADKAKVLPRKLSKRLWTDTTQQSGATDASAKVWAAEGYPPVVNFQQHNHHRSIAKD
jgi:hypothetical protein